MGARTAHFENFYFLTEIHYTPTCICLLLQKHLLCQQVAIITMQLDDTAIHILRLIRIERALG